jgi:hypothetical protein
MLHWVLTGLASTLPAASLARTEKLCVPSERPVYSLGELQAEKAWASSLHSKVTPDSGEEKEKLAEVLVTWPEMPESRVVSGGALSTVTVWAVEVDSLSGDAAGSEGSYGRIQRK